MREPKLDPVRRPRLPRGRAVLRTGLVAALLLTAAGALYARDPTGCPPPAPAATSPRAPVSPLASGDRLTVPAGAVGVPVRLSEPAVLALVHPGDRVDLLATATGAEPALAAADALVLGVVGTDGAVLLALGPDRARAVVGMPENTRFGVIVR
jgi:hypothetical protein